LPFLKIADVIAAVLDRIPASPVPDLAAVMRVDAEARTTATNCVEVRT
jgi:1-deoxy-D-xylulose 5-phosphate reductoisomerase